jgi:hypothetical protein
MFLVADRLLERRVSLVAEANFFRGSEPRFRALPPHRFVQVYCRAPLEVVLDRFEARERHPGHLDAQRVEELAARFETGENAPLELPGELIEVDTTAPVDVDALARRIRRG